MLAALNSGDKIQLAIALITGLAVVVAAASAWIGILDERKRTQPIVIAHEQNGRHLLQPGAWGVDAWLTNEGSGPAFNVQFGVEFHGIRFPYRLQPDDPGGGNVQRVIRPGDRRPDGDSWPVLLNSAEIYGMAASHGDLESGRIYWARYENTQGKTWETRNQRIGRPSSTSSGSVVSGGGNGGRINGERRPRRMDESGNERFFRS